MRIFILWIFLALPASAQFQLPALYDVTGVPSDDVLNVREAGATDAPIVGTFAHDASGIEVIKVEGNWGLVNVQSEYPGWASMTYLRPQGPASPVLEALDCTGAEPYWSLTQTGDDQVVFNEFNSGDKETLDIITRRTPLGRVIYSSILIAEGGTMRLTGFVQLQQCGDMMSDRAYGMGISLLVEKAGDTGTQDGDTVYMLDGCCSLTSP